MNDNISRLQEIINKARRLVFFGGAGGATASGIPDFRSGDGLYASGYEGMSPEKTMIIAGTSLAVQPAASYVEHFTGRELVIINKEPTPADSRATLLIRGDVSEIFSQITT